MHEDTQYNVNCGAGEPTREEHLCCKERQGTCVMIRQKNLAFAGVPKGLFRSEEHTSELHHEWISRMPSSA